MTLLDDPPKARSRRPAASRQQRSSASRQQRSSASRQQPRPKRPDRRRNLLSKLARLTRSSIRAAQARQARRAPAPRSTPPFDPLRSGRRRSLALLGIFVLSAGVLVAMLVRLQVVAPERYVERGLQQRLSNQPLLAARGSIFDRVGEPLATTLPAMAVAADPARVVDAAATAAALAPLLGIEEAEVRDVLAREDSRFAYIARQLDPEIAARVSELGLPGISVTDELRRVSAADDLGMSILGRLDTFGETAAFGLELQHDSRLRGTDGQRIAERNLDGDTIAGSEGGDAPVPGSDLSLTIDRSLQFWSESVLIDQVTSLEAAGGTVVLGRPSTGEVLAMASVVNADGDVRGSKLNLAVRTYEPGSVMKALTVAAAFEEGVVEPETVLTVPGRIRLADRTIRDAWSHGDLELSVNEIIARSSNVGTIMIAQMLGQEKILEYLDKFGLGEVTSLGLHKEQAGDFRREWYGSDIGSIPIGQSITATPLQIWSIYNTIANGGEYVAPRLVDHWTSPTGEVDAPERAANRRVISREAAAKAALALEQVTIDGTGRKLNLPDYRVAGKTGTAYQPLGPELGYGNEGNRHRVASFAGFFPVSNPQISIMVMIDRPAYGNHSGGQAAGPVFERLAKESMRRFGIAPDGAAALEANGPAKADAARPQVLPAPPTTLPPADGTQPEPYRAPVAPPTTAPAPGPVVAAPAPSTAPSSGRPSASDLASAPPPDSAGGGP